MNIKLILASAVSAVNAELFHNVDDIMATFTSTIDKLEKAAAKHNATGDLLSEKSDTLETEAAERFNTEMDAASRTYSQAMRAWEEAHRAEATAQKLKDFLSLN